MDRPTLLTWITGGSISDDKTDTTDGYSSLDSSLSPRSFMNSIEAPPRSARGEEISGSPEELISRLHNKDSWLKEISITTPFADNSLWFEFADALKNNDNITSIIIANANLDDISCLLLIPSFATCIKLRRLALVNNHLTSVSITAIATMIETHPSVQELYLNNQTTNESSAKTESSNESSLYGEESIANMMSQNKDILKISYDFKSSFIAKYASKFLKRNILYNKQRTSSSYSPRGGSKSGQSKGILTSLSFSAKGQNYDLLCVYIVLMCICLCMCILQESLL